MIKLVRVPLLYGTLICGMTGATGVASAQSVPFYPTARQTYYDVGIPGTMTTSRPAAVRSII